MPRILPPYGAAPIHTDFEGAQLVGIGSLLHYLPREFSGHIWGTGLMSDEFQVVVGERARIHALRGHLTAENVLPVGAPLPTLGDPGIMISRVLPRAPQRSVIAIVPHYLHYAEPYVAALASRLGERVSVVDVTKPPSRVVKAISSSSIVFTTSLHGLIVADSYGIPAVWSSPAPTLGGGDFKFRDYESIYSEFLNRQVDHPDDILDRAALGRWARRPDAKDVAIAISALESSLADLLASFKDAAPSRSFILHEGLRIAKRRGLLFSGRQEEIGSTGGASLEN